MSPLLTKALLNSSSMTCFEFIFRDHETLVRMYCMPPVHRLQATAAVMHDEAGGTSPHQSQTKSPKTIDSGDYIRVLR